MRLRSDRDRRSFEKRLVLVMRAVKEFVTLCHRALAAATLPVSTWNVRAHSSSLDWN